MVVPIGYKLSIFILYVFYASAGYLQCKHYALLLVDDLFQSYSTLMKIRSPRTKENK